MCKIVDVKVGNRQVKVADIKTKYLANIAASAKECPLIDKIVWKYQEDFPKARKSRRIIYSS